MDRRKTPSSRVGAPAPYRGTRRPLRLAGPLAAAAIVLAACGGGGGSGGLSQGAPAPVEPMPPPCVETHGQGCVPESDYDALAGRRRRPARGDRELREPVGPRGGRRRPGLCQPRAAAGPRRQAGRGRHRRRPGYRRRRRAPRVPRHEGRRAVPRRRDGRGRQPLLARHGGGRHHSRAGRSGYRARRIGRRMGRRPRRLRDPPRLQRRDLQASCDRPAGAERAGLRRILRRHYRVARRGRTHRFPEPEPGHPGDRREIRRSGTFASP